MNDKKTSEVSLKETSKRRLMRKFRLGAVATVTTAVVLVAILLLNVVMDTVESRFPFAIDLTAEGTYSLSDNSIALAKGVEKDVQIIAFRNETYFESPNTGYEQLNTIITQFYQTLKHYKMESGGKVTYEFIDLDANPTIAARYQDFNVTANTILFLSGDRSQTITLDDLYSNDMDYTTYAYTFASEVERVVAARINLVTAPNIKTVTVLTGHGEDEGTITSLEELLSNNGCIVERLDITASAEPVEDTSVLVIPGAKTDYSPAEIAKVRKWVDNDGKREVDLVVFTDSSVRLPNLYEMLNDQFGIEVQEQIVAETDTANVYNQQPKCVYGDVQSTDFTASLVGKRTLMIEAAPLKLNISTSSDQSKYAKVIVSHGETAKVQPLASKLGEEDESSNEEEMLDAESYPIVTAAYTTDRMFDNDDGRYYTTDVMVFGTTAFVYNPVFDVTSACNEEAFMAVFRGLTGLDSVISISSRSMDVKTLDFGGSKVPNVLGWVFMGILPLSIVAVSIIVFVRRRRL